MSGQVGYGHDAGLSWTLTSYRLIYFGDYDCEVAIWVGRQWSLWLEISEKY